MSVKLTLLTKLSSMWVLHRFASLGEVYKYGDPTKATAVCEAQQEGSETQGWESKE